MNPRGLGWQSPPRFIHCYIYLLQSMCVSGNGLVEALHSFDECTYAAGPRTLQLCQAISLSAYLQEELSALVSLS